MDTKKNARGHEVKQILSSRDYDQFKFFKENRPVSTKRVKHIMDSIEQANLLEYRPILVDADMHVVDGQHRLAAAKALGLPIYYQVVDQSVDALNAIGLLNAHGRNWATVDYIRFFAEQGNETYIIVRDLQEEVQLDVRFIISSLCIYGDRLDSVKKGLLKLRENWEVKRSQVRAVHEIILPLEKVMLGRNLTKTRGFAFCRGMQMIVCAEGVDLPRLERMLCQCWESIQFPAASGDVFNMLKRIYNYKLGEANRIEHPGRD